MPVLLNGFEASVLLAAMDSLLVDSGRMRLSLAAVFPEGKKSLDSPELRADFETAHTFIAAADVAAMELAKSLAAGQLTEGVLKALEYSQRCASRAAAAGRRLNQVAQFVATVPCNPHGVH